VDKKCPSHRPTQAKWAPVPIICNYLHSVPVAAKASAGQAALLPVHVSATSHGPVAALQDTHTEQVASRHKDMPEDNVSWEILAFPCAACSHCSTLNFSELR